MKLAFSTVLLASVLCLPASVPGISGGLPDCDGNTTTFTCQEANGAACNDLGNTYESVDDEDTQVVIKGSEKKDCKKENGDNDDCSGTAWKPSSKCE